MISKQVRRGVTLTETLVAIFVCGIGLIALMTLFPLGALNMAQALRDDRAAHCAANASAILRAIYRMSRTSGQLDPDFERALARGPVFLDPVGFGNGNRTSVGGIPRVGLKASNDPKATLRWFTMLDDIQFARHGTPDGEPVQVRREGRFSWAYLIRQLQPGDPRALQFAVVVYQNRPVTLGMINVASGETTCGAVFQGGRSVNISYGSTKPKLRNGGWILDSTPGGANQAGYNHFYRVSNVRDMGGSMQLELNTPLRGRVGAGQVTILDHVIEVFERNSLE